MVDYAFYMVEYNGSAITDAQEWWTFSKRAEEQLSCFKRIYTVQPLGKPVGCNMPDFWDAIKKTDNCAENMAVCAMADALFYFATSQNGQGVLSSASIGSVSVSYNAPKTVDLSPRAQERELFRCASLYLDIYRGVG